jgi:prolyl-tRNA synthetase
MGLAAKVGKLFVDHAVAAMAHGVSGANKTDYHMRSVVPGRDFPLSGANVVVTDIRNAVEGDTYQGKKLLFRNGIEVGQVFKLGTKYSAKLGTTFLDENGKEWPCLMGCYGIGINRILASAIEADHDADGIVWPISIAPFEVLVTSVNQNDPAVAQAAETIYQQLKAKGVDVLLDDREARSGVKFKDADLIGIPLRVTVGSRGVAEGTVEIKQRGGEAVDKVSIVEVANVVADKVKALYATLK